MQLKQILMCRNTSIAISVPPPSPLPPQFLQINPKGVGGGWEWDGEAAMAWQLEEMLHNLLQVFAG